MTDPTNAAGTTTITQESIALQLYTLRDLTAQDFLGTLHRVADMGYRAVEFAGYGGVPIPDLRAALDEYGLRAMGAHVPLAHFESRLSAALSELTLLGCQYAVVPWLPPERRVPDQAPDLASSFNRFAAAAQAEGLAFAYHNHDFEFAAVPGDAAGHTFFDVLVAQTDPALVGFELDLYWAAFAGVDPLALLHRLSRRAPLLHMKDMGPAPGRADLPVGNGTLPWSELLPAGAAAGARWYIVEQDHPTDLLADVERSLRYLESMAAVNSQQPSP